MTAASIPARPSPATKGSATGKKRRAAAAAAAAADFLSLADDDAAGAEGNAATSAAATAVAAGAAGAVQRAFLDVAPDVAGDFVVAHHSVAKYLAVAKLLPTPPR
jgi:hypothetical protein